SGVRSGTGFLQTAGNLQGPSSRRPPALQERGPAIPPIIKVARGGPRVCFLSPRWRETRRPHEKRPRGFPAGAIPTVDFLLHHFALVVKKTAVKTHDRRSLHAARRAAYSAGMA